MKFRILINALLIAILSYVLHYFVPIWWLFVFAAFGVAYLLGKKASIAFLSGFLGIFALWFGLMAVNSFQNEGILLNRMTDLIGLPHGIVLILLSAFIGGLLGGFGALTGFWFKTIKIENKSLKETEENINTPKATEEIVENQVDANS